MKTHLLTLSPAEFCKATNACPEGATFAAQYQTMAEVWDNCPRPDWIFWILYAINSPTDDKALRLFACWCVRETPLADGRKMWDLLTDKRSRNAVVVAERYCNGQATQKELDSAGDAAEAVARDAAGDAADAAEAVARDAAGDAAEAAAWAAAWAVARYAAGAAARAVAGDAAGAAARAVARAAQCKKLRSIVSNPFRA